MRCSFCKNESVYFRIYEGHAYCEKHFKRNVEKKVKKTLGSNRLVERGDRVAVAFSGGKDSSNLLFLLNEIFKGNPNVSFFAITINEGIKGYRDEAIKKSKVFCEELGIEQRIFSYKEEFGFTIDDLSKKMRFGFCGSCGILKRYLLNKKARELGATKLATGHTLDDECQSIIMNVLRGDLLRLVRVGPIPMLSKHPKFVTRIKPLVLIPENESELFAFTNKIPFYPKKCPYAFDNELRGKIEEFLNDLEKTSPGIKYSLYESAQKIVPFVKKKFETEKIGTCEKCGEPSSQSVCKVCKLLEKLSS